MLYYHPCLHMKSSGNVHILWPHNSNCKNSSLMKQYLLQETFIHKEFISVIFIIAKEKGGEGTIAQVQ